MFALIAAVVLFLHAFGILENSGDVDWWVLGIGFVALHLALAWPIGWPPNRPG